MKKYLIISAAVIALFSFHNSKALAYDIYDVHNYIQVDDARILSNGNLSVGWHKAGPGAGAGIPDPNFSIAFCGPGVTYVFMSINGTTTLTTMGVPQFPITTNGSYGFASTAPNGNNETNNMIWDVATGANVPTSQIISSNPSQRLWFNMENVYANSLGCPSTFHAYFYPTAGDQYNLLVNANDIPFSYTYVTPAASSTIGNFPNWNGNITYNGSGNPSSTVTISVGNSSSALSVAASGTFYLLNGNNPITIANDNQDYLSPQQTGPVDWYYQASVNSSGTTINFPITHFITSPNAPGGVCDDPVSVSLATPFPSSTITNDFSAWKVSTPALLEGCTYTLQVSMTAEIGSLAGTTDQVAIGVNPQNNPTSVLVNKQKNIWNFYNGTTTKMDYFVQLINNADGVTAGTDSGSFYLGFSATSSPLTAPRGFNPTQQCGGVCQGFGTIGGGSIATPSSTIAGSGNGCIPASDWTDIGGGIAYGFCTTLNFLFVPGAGSQAILSNDMNILESVPPFSWFFLTNAQIAAVANGDTSYVTPNGTAVYTINPNVSTTPNNGISFDIFTGIDGATTSLQLLPADLTTNSFLHSGKGAQLVDDYYNFILTAAILVIILMLYKLAL